MPAPATAPLRRLAALAGVVLGLLLALELLCRALPEGLAAVAHRVRFKLALLHRQESVDVVAFGSSRTNDGFEPRAFREAGGGAEPFNAATPASSLATLEFFATRWRVSGRPVALVELSRPQSVAGEMDADAFIDPKTFAGDPVGLWLVQESALLQRRRAFALENLPRVAGLLVADSLDGSEWFRRSPLMETFLPAPTDPADDDASAWTPATASGDVPLDDDGRRVVEGYARVVEALRAKGVRVVLVTPPVAASFRAEECSAAWNSVRAAIVAKTDAETLDYGCAPMADGWFVDGQHLSSRGRNHFSGVLGKALRALP